jgi:hypothetical protein
LAVTINYAGRSRQLEYEVELESLSPQCKLKRVRFENVLGIGVGKWDFIVKENVDDAIRLLAEFVTYASGLTSRLPVGCFAARTV